MKKSRTVTSLVIAMVIAVVATVHAAAPRKINYQGYLTNPAGAPLTGTYPMVFSLCDAATAGTCPWTETQSVAIDKGIFNVSLGAVTPLSLAFDIPYYLDIQVNGEQMSARQPLTSVGYAFQADSAMTATTATNFTGSMSGDVTGTQTATSVNSVGGQTAASVATGAALANSATSSNTFSTIVRRDASGNFSAGNITANLSGNALSATALAANGTNCPAGQYPLGVDASGNAEGCTVAGGGADSTAPTPGNSGAITANRSGTDIVLSWTAANDSVTPQSNLEYTAVYSTSNNIGSVANAEANGIVVGVSRASNITTKTISGINAATTYYCNVLVSDAALNKAVYTTVVNAPAAFIAMYGTETAYDGNLGGRSGADAKCNASSNKPAGFSHYAAFLSVGSSDSISGRQGFSGLNTSLPIRSTNGTLIANNWSDLLDGTIATTLAAAGVSMSTGYWWSGSNADGTAGLTCSGWTSNVNADAGGSPAGDWGTNNNTGSLWINPGNVDRTLCNEPTNILCIAW